MKKIAIFFLLLIGANLAYAQNGTKLQRPKLVVGIVVDQMRWDYLYRYYDRYGDGGFKRLMANGYNCQNAMINFIPSATGPGHASIYTGSVPAIHGVVSNGWIDRATGKGVYCVEDDKVNAVNGSIRSGKMSPRNLYTTTITDELRLATNMRGKVYGIGIKDRGSILPAGHNPNGAFWFDDSTGNFITSDYYMNTLPRWLVDFNNARYADTFANQTWNTLYDKSTYVNSLPDNNKFEGLLKGEEEPVFPHHMVGNMQKGYKYLRYAPGGNTITLMLSEACIKGELLGADNITDFLCVTLSTTDYAGHNYAPNALEMEDMYLRLDLELAKFLTYLDNTVGKNNYTLFLTADHGAAHNAGYLKSINIPAGNKTESDVEDALDKYLQSIYHVEGLVKGLSSYQVYLHEDKISNSNINRDSLKLVIKTWFEQQDGIANVVDIENPHLVALPEPIQTMVVNSIYPERNGSLLIITKPGWYSGYGYTGTTHGSWNPYDSHIPLLWYGWGVKKGVSYKTVYMTDIAATLAALLHIQMPNGCVGNVIEEVIKQ